MYDIKINQIQSNSFSLYKQKRNFKCALFTIIELDEDFTIGGIFKNEII